MNILKKVLICGLILSVFCIVQPIRAQSADAIQLAEHGRGLLAKGDFEGSLKQFAQAARTEPGNMVWRETYALLRQVIKMRQSLEMEKNPAKWEYTARALRAFYRDNNLYKEALPLDQKFYELKQDAESALLLAETQLELDMNQPMLDFTDGLSKDTVSDGVTLLRAIALARLEKNDEALQLLQSVKLPEKPAGIIYFYRARIQSLSGKSDDALESLTTAFETTPPAFLPALKNRTQKCSDFQSFYEKAQENQKPAPKESFVKVLQTQSKIEESGCTGGSSCATCQHSSSCSSASASASCEKQ